MGNRRVHVVEQPFVGFDLSVEPHAVVQTRAHKRSVIPANVVGTQDGVEETHVAGVGDDARVQQLVVGQCSVSLNPHLLRGIARSRGAPRQFSDEPLIDGVLALKPFVNLLTVTRGLYAFEQRRDRFRLLNFRSDSLMVETIFFSVKTCLHVVDRSTVLNGDHASSREALAIANAVNFIENGHLGIAGAQKVGVERVHSTLVDGPSGGHEGLRGNLATEYPLAFFVGLGTTKDVDFNSFEVEEVDKEIESFRHVYMVGETAFAYSAV